MKPRVWKFAVVSLLGCSGVTWADTLVLKDGSFVEGQIAAETDSTVKIKTRFGTRTYNKRKEVENILKAPGALDAQAASQFGELPAALRAALNAQVDYDQKRYTGALARLEPFRKYEDSKPVRLRIDWLIIEIHERLGQWEKARALLEAKKAGDAHHEQVRAAAHLAIFQANPDYDLRFVGEKHARNFLRTEALLELARKPNALADAEIMQRALEEYCEQLLLEGDRSIKRFGEKLDAKATYDACKKLPRTGEVSRSLPYIDELKRVETTLGNVRAILGDDCIAFEMDLVRTELYHLLPVMLRLLTDVATLSLEDFVPANDPRTRQMTKPGQTQWRERCEQLEAAARPLQRLVEYMVDRVNLFPEALRDLRKALLKIQVRLEHMLNAVKRAKDNTHV